MTHKLGKYFSLEEMTLSGTALRLGIKNEPDKDEIENLRLLVAHVLDPLRERIGSIHVSSGFRSQALNKATGGTASSQHRLGQAADIQSAVLTPYEVCKTIVAMGLPFDQLIEEFGGWVHVSYSSRHRRQVLQARKVNGKTAYRPLNI